LRFVATLELTHGSTTAAPLPPFLLEPNTSLSLSQFGLEFVYTPQSFVQNHPEQSARINEHILRLATREGKILDLYCGFGVTAIAMAKTGAAVTGVELNEASIKLAKRNAATNKVEVEFICADVANYLAPALRKQKPDLILVNPPRTGLDTSVSAALAKSGVESIIYVSCMPQTLARDLAVLVASGYRIEECQPYDMFPQTTHVETLVLLRKQNV
jgi:23S rRNA (uracil1939-C5)-methyltransferase